MSCYRGNLLDIAHRITFQKISSTSEGVLYSNVHKGVGPYPPLPGADRAQKACQDFLILPCSAKVTVQCY
jgi:hypothetical protein